MSAVSSQQAPNAIGILMAVSTLFCLMAEFGTSQIPLEAVADKYWSLTRQIACNRALQHKLPVPAYRGSDSQKSGWFINAADLAEHLDRQREAARVEWEKFNRGAREQITAEFRRLADIESRLAEQVGIGPGGRAARFGVRLAAEPERE